MTPWTFAWSLIRPGLPYGLLGALLGVGVHLVTACGPLAYQSISEEEATRLAVASCRGLVTAGLAYQKADEDGPEPTARDVAASTAAGLVCAGSATLAALYWAGYVEAPPEPPDAPPPPEGDEQPEEGPAPAASGVPRP